MNQELVPIYSAKDALLAEMLRAELENLGIQAWIVNDKLGNALGELPPGWSTNPRLLVAADQADKARRLAEEFDRRTSSHIGARGSQEEPESTDVEENTLDPWPRCPECHQRRLAVCRICQTSGNNFPLAYGSEPADVAEDAGDIQVMVVCPGCDEPFRPEFYKLCEYCGHEFPSGRSVRQPMLPRDATDPEINPARVYLVLLVVVGIFLAAAGYLWSLSF